MRFAGGRVGDEVQLIEMFSPRKYLEKKVCFNLLLLLPPSLVLPAASSYQFRTFQGDDHHQEVSVCAVRGKCWSLLAHLAPVAASAVQRERGEGDVVHAGLGQLHGDAGQVVDGDWTELAREVTEELLPVFVPPHAVHRLDAGVAAVEDGVLPVHSVLRHRHPAHVDGGVGRGSVQG